MAFLHSWSVDFLSFIILFGIFLYIYLTRKYTYWKRKNVDFLQLIPFFGVAFDILTQRKSLAQTMREMYESTKKPYFGFFIFTRPCLLICDPNLVKTILIKDANIWENHTTAVSQKNDPMSSNFLLMLKSERWKEARKKSSPLFSSSQVKIMYNLIKAVAEEMVTYVERETKKNPIMQIRELCGRYTTEVIASTSFGVNANCFKNEISELRQVTRRVRNWNIFERVIATTSFFIAPKLVELFKLKFVDAESQKVLRNIFWTIVKNREEQNFLRNDIIDLLIQMKKGMPADYAFKREGDKFVSLAAQFFIAGYETTSTIINLLLYYMAANPTYQDTLRKEIISVREKHNGFTYNSLQEMSFLSMCVKETLRLVPPLQFLDRQCSRKYQIPGTDIELEKGTAVYISMWGIHLNPEYYPDPSKYNPYRFCEENQKSRSTYVYMPFGDGQRRCIGERLGMLLVTCGVAHLISTFRFELCDRTVHPLKFSKKGFMIAEEPYMVLKVTNI